MNRTPIQFFAGKIATIDSVERQNAMRAKSGVLWRSRAPFSTISVSNQFLFDRFLNVSKPSS
jgi:hypothetical protein